MITFGLMMLVANMAFIPAEQVRWLARRLAPQSAEASSTVPIVNAPRHQQRRRKSVH